MNKSRIKKVGIIIMSRLREFNEDVLVKIDEVANYIEETYDIDLGNTKKTNRQVALRALFCYVLYEKLNLTDRLITEWLIENRGLTKNRSTIWFLINKIEEYLVNFPYIVPAYEHFMDNDVVHHQNLPEGVFLSNRMIDAVKDIPEHRVDEIIELINLRKKSWEWKSKDRVEIINCQL